MINKDYEKIPNNIINTPSGKASLQHALMRLKEFSDKMENSDFKNSYTKYSVELKLVAKAINECKDEDSKTLEILNARKKFLLDKLKTFGVHYK